MNIPRPLRLAVALLLALVIACSEQPAPRPGPTPSLKPEDVVRTVMTALKDNDHPGPDAGIATAFEFASPENKRQTGPLQRFIPMVKSPGYRPMLNFIEIQYMPVVQHGNQAEQVVRIKAAHNESATYVFMLRRQPDGAYKDCWMTDGVMRLREEPAATQTQPDAPVEPEVPKRPAEPV